MSLICYQDLGQAENYCAKWADIVTQLNALFPHYKGGGKHPGYSAKRKKLDTSEVDNGKEAREQGEKGRP